MNLIMFCRIFVLFNKSLNINKKGNVPITQHGGAFVQPFLQWKSSITYSECVFVSLVIQHAKRMYCILLWSATSALQHYFISQTAQLRKESYST